MEQLMIDAYARWEVRYIRCVEGELQIVVGADEGRMKCTKRLGIHLKARMHTWAHIYIYIYVCLYMLI